MIKGSIPLRSSEKKFTHWSQFVLQCEISYTENYQCSEFDTYQSSYNLSFKVEILYSH